MVQNSETVLRVDISGQLMKQNALRVRACYFKIWHLDVSNILSMRNLGNGKCWKNSQTFP